MFWLEEVWPPLEGTEDMLALEEMTPPSWASVESPAARASFILVREVWFLRAVRRRFWMDWEFLMGGEGFGNGEKK